MMKNKLVTVYVFCDNCFERLDRIAHHSAQWKTVPWFVQDINECCRSCILCDDI
jgi:hypothetical protein